MTQVIFDWLNNNAMAIFISGMVSLEISRRYYNKANRENVLMTIIFPIIQILEHDNMYTKSKYEKLSHIKSNYAIRYLHKNERNKLLVLINDYRNVCRYDESGVKTDSIMEYYESKLKEKGINPKSREVENEEGKVVAYDYPVDYLRLVDQVHDIISLAEDDISSDECKTRIVSLINQYTKEFYNNQKIFLFNDCSIEKVIANSNATKKWNERFKAVKKSRQEFLNLSISKKVLRIIDSSKHINI